MEEKEVEIPPTLVCVTYPGNVVNEEKAIENLGGLGKMSEVRLFELYTCIKKRSIIIKIVLDIREGQVSSEINIQAPECVRQERKGRQLDNEWCAN